VQSLDELVDDQALRADVGGAQPDVEADAGVTKRVVPDGRLMLGHAALDLVHHFPAYLHRDLLDVL
jgi:hypothetical protein